MRVLLIEDDPSTARSIELVLERASFNVTLSDLGEEGIDLARFYEFDLILLDLGLPDMSGYDVLRQLRMSRISTPVLILTGENGTESMLKGFGSGADDYITKPFNREELLARAHAIIRRSNGHAASVISTGPLMFDLDAKLASVSGRELKLTGKEHQILELLLLRKGTTVSKETFLNHLYGGIDEPEPKIIDVFICKLRKKIQAATGGDSMIETVWGRGYLLRNQKSLPTVRDQALSVA